MKLQTTLIAVLLAIGVLAPSAASALCAVEGKLDAVRLDLDQVLAFVLHVRTPRAVVSNAFQVERTQSGGLGDIPTLIQLLSLASSGNTTILAVGDLATCPDATEIERARSENRGVFSGKLLRVFVKYR